MTEQPMNGASYHQPDALEQAARDIQRLVAQMPASAPVQEVSPPSANPFDQESHDSCSNRSIG